ncbi:MAG: HlyD family efflux transporter periplasmic adaptor subunit [Bacteroidales bacterium]|jgi:hypothetical protein|nr:HlyD family efflux transporter periplasmic adaptor subunit [Bacteroidales bacterium]
MEKEIENINSKSEEVQSIIDRMPTNWAKLISIITCILIIFIIFLGFIIKYPDTVDGQINITASIAPVKIVSHSSGRLHLIKQNKSYLKEGDLIAYIESGTNYKDVLFLDSILHTFNPHNKNIVALPFNLNLGEVGSAYNTFFIAYLEYERLIGSDLYKIIRETLYDKIEVDKDIISNIDVGIDIKKNIISGSTVQLEKDKELLSIKAITEDVFEDKKQNLLSKEESLVNLENSKLSKLSEISNNIYEIQKNKLEEKDKKDRALSELISSINNLSNLIQIWKEKYLHYSTLDGELEYLGFWRENYFISSGQELFSIIPVKNEIMGEVFIPSIGAGKVKIGQTANVKINNYPYDEYGLLKGKVESLSRISNTIETKDGKGEAYQVIISFPDGLVSNFGINLRIDFETKGIVEIVTKPKRLIERLFDNLKAKTEK